MSFKTLFSQNGERKDSVSKVFLWFIYFSSCCFGMLKLVGQLLQTHKLLQAKPCEVFCVNKPVFPKNFHVSSSKCIIKVLRLVSGPGK